jgi:hypothetical protein
LKADLATFNESQAQEDAAEIDRLHEENRDLLKLRNEINQLRDAKAEFQRVSAENQRLKSRPKDEPKVRVVINMNGLYDRGLNTPEAALQTFLWTEREGNSVAMARCVTPRSASQARDFLRGDQKYFGTIDSLEIVARREVDAKTVQLGVAFRIPNKPQNNTVFNFVLSNGEWRLDF